MWNSVYTIKSKPIANNTYVIGEEGKSCVVIDPSFNHAGLLQTIRAHFHTVEAILLTHGHVDHIVGIDALVAHYPAPVYLHPLDFEMLTDPHYNGSVAFGLHTIVNTPVQPLDDYHNNQVIVYESPGHSPGCVAFYVPHLKLLFSGDTLFKQGLGRTDLPGGSQRHLLDSRDYLLQLPVDTLVYPGHDQSSTIAAERLFHRYKGK